MIDHRTSTSGQAAWHRIQELGLAPTPENYALFFAYFSRQEEELTKSVDSVLIEAAQDVMKLTTGLGNVYQRYISSQNKETLLRDTAAQFDEEVREILNLVADVRAGNDKYGDALNKFDAGLNDSASIEQVKALVSSMAQHTKDVAAQNQKLQEQLNTSVNQINDLRTNLDDIRKESMVDELTNVGNRKAFVADIQRVTAETIERGDSLSILMVDIDFFKKFNDRYGHLIGDQVLKLVAHTLKENVKGRDSVARWGGEEFAILLPNTRLEDAVKLGDHLRRLVATKKIVRKPQNEELGSITLSMGATQYVYGEDHNDFVDRADQALYRAKQEGRNRVEAAMPSSLGAAATPLRTAVNQAYAD